MKLKKIPNCVLFTLLGFSLCFFSACQKKHKQNAVVSLQSPNAEIEIKLGLSNDNQPWYAVLHKSTSVIDTSIIGFSFANAPTFFDNLTITKTTFSQQHTSWKPIWGQQKEIENKYNQTTVTLKDTLDRELDLAFRAYDDGVAFRYVFSERENWPQKLTITDEKTTFNLLEDYESWWIPANYDSYEHKTVHSRASEIEITEDQLNYFLVKGIKNLKAVHTPLTLRSAKNNLHLSIHEAALLDYPSTTLEKHVSNLGFEIDLVPAADGTKATVSLPFQTPWRTIQISETPKGLVESSLLLNLNAPNKISDTSWIKPAKYIGVWWGIHIGKYTFEPSEKHGATTENAKAYIDFAAANGIKAVLIEGWNKGINFFVGKSTELPNFTTPTHDYHLAEVSRYASERGIELIGYHETGAHVENYAQHIDSAMGYLKKHGIDYLKVGFVGKIIPKGEYHHGQWMVNFYQKVTETAAKHNIMLIVHEPVKPTGLCRTWPNLMTQEGVRGQEFDAWSEGNPPNHLTIIPFTRGLAGPIDYTPGVFDVHFDAYRKGNSVKTTLCKQLAAYVVLYSPIQMAADLPENYKKYDDAFTFIKSVPTDWSETRFLSGSIGEYIAMARKDKKSEEWFVGALTNEDSRTIELPLHFLNDTKTYTAIVFADAKNTNYKTNPNDYTIAEYKVSSNTTLKPFLASSGGVAIHIKPII